MQAAGLHHMPGALGAILPQLGVPVGGGDTLGRHQGASRLTYPMGFQRTRACPSHRPTACRLLLPRHGLAATLRMTSGGTARLRFFPSRFLLLRLQMGELANDVSHKSRDRLVQIIRKVPKEQNTSVEVAEGHTIDLKMRVFVVNSEDAKAVGEYMSSHLSQNPAPFVLLAKHIPMAVLYDPTTLDLGDASVADRLRKQAKTRTVKVSFVDAGGLFGRSSPTADVLEPTPPCPPLSSRPVLYHPSSTVYFSQVLRESIANKSLGVTTQMLRGHLGPLEPSQRLEAALQVRCLLLDPGRFKVDWANPAPEIMACFINLPDANPPQRFCLGALPSFSLVFLFCLVRVQALCQPVMGECSTGDAGGSSSGNYIVFAARNKAAGSAPSSPRQRTTPTGANNKRGASASQLHRKILDKALKKAKKSPSTPAAAPDTPPLGLPNPASFARMG